MTFQEQCMKTVFPRFIEGINAANRKVESVASEVTHVFPRFSEAVDAVNGKVEALTSEIAQLQAKVQELEETLAEIREHGGDLINDLLDRVNSLEAKAAEKKTRKPRAKKQADPVQMVEQAAQAAIVETPEQAMNEIPF